MKKLYTLVAAVLLTTISFAQAPEKMSYQAVIRDAANALVTNQAIGMQISILQGSSTGTAVYIETQIPTTNINGLVSLEIGLGTTTDDFTAIDWATGPYFIKTETDPTGGSSYSITGISQLLSVPYALYAKTVGQPTYTVNTFYAVLGGFVIEINTDGTHGLVVAMQDQGFSSWYEANDLLSNAVNHDSDGAKFKDWCLPSKRELNLLYQVFSNGNGAALNAGYYWSSTQGEGSGAWLQGFASVGQFYAFKKDAFNVRAVRAF